MLQRTRDFSPKLNPRAASQSPDQQGFTEVGQASRACPPCTARCLRATKASTSEKWKALIDSVVRNI
jgi:hypothetical protein